jgi:hypothetical protein
MTYPSFLPRSSNCSSESSSTSFSRSSRDGPLTSESVDDARFPNTFNTLDSAQTDRVLPTHRRNADNYSTFRRIWEPWVTHGTLVRRHRNANGQDDLDRRQEYARWQRTRHCLICNLQNSGLTSYSFVRCHHTFLSRSTAGFYLNDTDLETFNQTFGLVLPGQMLRHEINMSRIFTGQLGRAS